MFFFPIPKALKKILRPFYKAIYNFPNLIWDSRLKVLCSVKESGEDIFKIYDYGIVTRLRASTFERKEPETLRWIKTFDRNDKLLDVGANVGLYSLYGASKGISVVSIEPDALNYALLNLNIRINNYGDKIVPYAIALHDEKKFSKFNISSMKWGGALNSFDSSLDHKGNNSKFILKEFWNSLDNL